ncbi:LysR substrate-binding domain-containing protein [Streptomyces monashensis]|uniref:LysR substrate-binding domain-containing protein n=1 Tax=Streptomyces monashensis TaxID=1678012 RepID=UPI0033F49121
MRRRWFCRVRGRTRGLRGCGRGRTLTPSSVRALTDSGFATSNTSPRAFVTARGIPTVAGLVAANIGVSAVPTGVLPLLGSQTLAVRPLVDPVVTRRIRVLERRPAAPAAHAFHVVLTAAFAGTRRVPRGRCRCRRAEA